MHGKLRVLKMTITKLTLALITTITFSQAFAADVVGTPSEAKAMLERVIAAMEVDKIAALAAFNAGDIKYKDGDLYAFCAESDPEGVMLAHGGAPDKIVGVPSFTIKDAKGTRIGDIMIRTAVEGEIKMTDVYWWPIPDPANPTEKRSYYTLVADSVCGVAYFD